MTAAAARRGRCAAERNPDRVAAKRAADERGHFWLPCSRCGEWYGGGEVHASPGVQCLLDGSTFHGACCPKVDDDDDAHACRRAHEMHGDPSGCIRHDDCREMPAVAALCFLETRYDVKLIESDVGVYEVFADIIEKADDALAALAVLRGVLK